MTTRTRIARIAATAAVLLAAPAYAQQPIKDPLPLKPGTGPIVLRMGNDQGTLLGFTSTWSAGKVAEDQWDAPAVAAKLPTKVEPATLEFIASTGAPRTFYSWVTASFAGKIVGQAGEVIRASVTGPGHIAQFSAAVVGEVDFPQFTVGKTREAEFVVRAKGQWLPGTALKAMKAPIPALAKMPAATSALVSGYRLTLGTIQAASVEGLEPFTLRPLQAAKITLHTPAPLTEALQKLEPKTKQALGAGKAAGPDGRLDLLAADGRTVFATIALRDVQVEISGLTKPGIVGAVGAVKAGPGVVTLTAARAEPAFFPMMKTLQ
jgi:hypothetical protein